MMRGKALLVAVLALVAVSSAQEACTFDVGDGEVTYYPGLFNGGNASTDTQECTGSSTDVPEGSEWPFWFGTATAAYQVEGAWNEGGKGPSIWDTFTHTPGKIWNNETGDVAVDFYHKFLEDIQLMKSLGHRNYRFSISWPRIFPNGTGEINQEGVDFYNKVIDTLLANCIEPWVTVYHWDMPQALEDKYGGWLSDEVVPDFDNYARTVFELYGDRVKHWFTLNEPTSFCFNGYFLGTHAPGRCANRTQCEEGDQIGELLKCSYHAMLAHATATKTFREVVPDGKIGLTNIMYQNVALSDKPEDIEAAERLNVLNNAQFLDPIYTGDWSPERLALLPPALLPRFTDEQKALLKASKPDFLALQYYSGFYAYYNATSQLLQATTTITGPDNVTLPLAQPPWLAVFPLGLKELLIWLNNRYPNETMLITETGVAEPGENQKETLESLCDTFRINFYKEYIGNATEAVLENGVDLQGIFGWTLMDNFEWAAGTDWRFGIIRTDFETLQRYYKASSLWLSNKFGLSDVKSAADAVTSVASAA